MKKLISILLAVLLIAAVLTASVLASREPGGGAGSGDPVGMTGGWTATDSPEITEEVQALMDKATDSLVGVEYEPVAYLGTQIVAGTNHCILCHAAAVYPGAKGYYALVYIYEDLRGNAEILDIVTLDIGEMISYGEE